MVHVAPGDDDVFEVFVVLVLGMSPLSGCDCVPVEA